MKKLYVSMDRQGRLTVPVAVRQALKVAGPAQFELEVKGDRLILRRFEIPAEDAWAYTPEHIQRVKRAEADIRRGRVFTLTEEDLKRLLDLQ
jgi:bifunctional DNA-binding transcriptional regulator/antitoxin component of YhaV-PrlF toxin-antitoxin module